MWVLNFQWTLWNDCICNKGLWGWVVIPWTLKNMEALLYLSSELKRCWWTTFWRKQAPATVLVYHSVPTAHTPIVHSKTVITSIHDRLNVVQNSNSIKLSQWKGVNGNLHSIICKQATSVKANKRTLNTVSIDWNSSITHRQKTRSCWSHKLTFTNFKPITCIKTNFVEQLTDHANWQIDEHH